MTRANALLGSKVMHGSARVNQRSNFCEKCPVATKIGRKDPRPECYAFMGSKVFQGSAGVNQSANLLKMPYELPGVNQRAIEMRRAIKCSQCYRALCSMQVL